MIEGLKSRLVVCLVVLLLSLLWALPNFVPVGEGWWFSKNKLVYGLDIQGGLHLVMGVDVQGVIKEKTSRIARSVRSELETKEVVLKAAGLVDETKGEVVLQLENPADTSKVLDFIKNNYATTLQVISSENAEVRMKVFDNRILEYKQQVVQQAIEVIRNRIDEFGVAEPSIAAQGQDRIIIQLPGIEDSSKAKELVNRTAKLTFHIVSDEMSSEDLNKLITDTETEGGYSLGKDGLTYSNYIKKLNEDLKGKLPENTVVGFEKAQSATEMEAGKVAYLLRSDTDLGGDELEDAHVAPGEYGEPEVIFRFSPEGRTKFSDITEQNVKKQMAIVLDGVVQSAPVIQGKISTNTARITLNRRDFKQAQDEANFIAMALRAGALPAALQQLEERTVGPSVGADAVAKAKTAGIVALFLVFGFMLIYYRKLGVIANVALIMNILLIFAVLTSLGATLTLPGIAGIILTFGMAIDSNVIIYERIKEELRRGASIKAAVKDGFSNAFASIFDSNLTQVITCMVLIYYGTGPVRGFGVSLTIGIVASMFTAIFVSRTLIEFMVDKFKIQKLI